MKFRKEMVNKEIPNYHLNIEDIDQTLSFLEVNKKIHVRGIKKDALKTLLCGTMTLLIEYPLVRNSSAILMALGITGLFINFQCVNLQNYNIKRIGNNYERLKKLEARSLKKHTQEYTSASSFIAPLLNGTLSIPTTSDIITALPSEEEASNLQKMVQREIEARQKRKVGK